MLSKAFSDFGFGPFESLLLGTVTSAVIAGMTEGLVGQATTKLIAAFALKMKLASTPTPVPGGGGGGVGLPPIIPKVGGAVATTGLGALAASLAIPAAIITAGGTALLSVFAIGGKLLSGGKSVEEREKEWAEWSASLKPPRVDPMTDKYTSRTFNPVIDPMTAKYSSPTFNVYVGATTVADAVIPIIAKDINSNPRGGR